MIFISRNKPVPKTGAAEIFKDIRPGDLVAVDWGRRKELSPEYGAGGKVLQVTDRLVTIRGPTGYSFSVSLAQALTGVNITITKRGGNHVNGSTGTDERTTAENMRGDLPPPGAEPPTPLECVEKGIPLDQARIMTPKDLTRETAERLLAAGVAKEEIKRLYGYSTNQLCFMTLAKWGLYKATRPKLAAEDPPAEPPAAKPPRRNGMDVPLPVAISLRDRFKANLRAVEDIFLYATSGQLRLPEDVSRELAALQNKYAGELAKIESAFGPIRVTI